MRIHRIQEMRVQSTWLKKLLSRLRKYINSFGNHAKNIVAAAPDGKRIESRGEYNYSPYFIRGRSLSLPGEEEATCTTAFLIHHFHPSTAPHPLSSRAWRNPLLSRRRRRLRALEKPGYCKYLLHHSPSSSRPAPQRRIVGINWTRCSALLFIRARVRG